MDNFEAIEAAYVTFVAEHQAATKLCARHRKEQDDVKRQNWTTVEEGQRSAIYDEHLSKIPALKAAYDNAQH